MVIERLSPFYLAGYKDGDGSIMIHETGGKWLLHAMRISLNMQPLGLYMVDWFGGNYFSTKNKAGK